MQTMHKKEILLNPNPLVRHLMKPAAALTREDIIQFIEDRQIEVLNFKYVAEDGKLKTLNFVVSSKEQIETLLSTGERVDGSSLFSFVEAGRSDLYVIPRFKTAFVDPFAVQPTLNILCSFYNADGLPLESAPEYILRKACRDFERKTGYQVKAMGELEYYIKSPKDDLYPAPKQRGYHTSSPFANWEHIRVEAMRLIAQAGGKIKYGHSEVGFFQTETHAYEQHEIEFTPTDVEDAVDSLVVGKWILRMLGQRYGVQISFAPKIAVGNAGSGLHIHLLLEKDGENRMIANGVLSDPARKMIAGLLEYAAPLTAFGNTNPTSYLRLVPHQEAPTMVCWGDSNRSVLVRVPLGWVAETGMIKDANPQQTAEIPYVPGKQTVEFRVPDGSADLYHLLAGMLVAMRKGLLDDDALEKAQSWYVDVNIFDEKHRAIRERLSSLPRSCHESADSLEQNRSVFEEAGIFPKGAIDRVIRQLRAFDDKDLSARLYGNKEEIARLVEGYLHWA